MNADGDPVRPSRLLLDTHVLVWLVEGHSGLGSRARVAIQEAADRDGLVVSAITPWEIALLVSNSRLKLNKEALAWIEDALAMPGVAFAQLEPEIAVESTRLPWAMHADPADRILAATARHLGATLVTADEALLGFAANGCFAGMDARV